MKKLLEKVFPIKVVGTYYYTGEASKLRSLKVYVLGVRILYFEKDIKGY